MPVDGVTMKLVRELQIGEVVGAPNHPLYIVCGHPETDANRRCRALIAHLGEAVDVELREWLDMNAPVSVIDADYLPWKKEAIGVKVQSMRQQVVAIQAFIVGYQG